MKTITLGGKTYQLAINFKTLLTFEREFGGNALDISRFAEHAIEATSQLAYAMLAANNTDHPTYDELMGMEDMDEIAGLILAATQLYNEQMQAKPGDHSSKGEKAKGKKGDAEKNA